MPAFADDQPEDSEFDDLDLDEIVKNSLAETQPTAYELGEAAADYRDTDDRQHALARQQARMQLVQNAAKVNDLIADDQDARRLYDAIYGKSDMNKRGRFAHHVALVLLDDVQTDDGSQEFRYLGSSQYVIAQMTLVLLLDRLNKSTVATRMQFGFDLSDKMDDHTGAYKPNNALDESLALELAPMGQARLEQGDATTAQWIDAITNQAHKSHKRVLDLWRATAYLLTGQEAKQVEGLSDELASTISRVHSNLSLDDCFYTPNDRIVRVALPTAVVQAGQIINDAETMSAKYNNEPITYLKPQDIDKIRAIYDV